jgi:HPt (histidine-containing phosphotransfer) domain-containing protein
MTSDQPEATGATEAAGVAAAAAVPAADIDLAVLDETRVAKLFDLDNGGVGLFTELVELFRVAVHEHLDELDQRVVSGDIVSAKRVAHAICGESASMGATRVERQARHLEQLTTPESLESAASLVAELRRSVDHSIVAMDEEIARRRCAVL